MGKTFPSKIQKTASDLVKIEGGKHSMSMADGRQAIAWVCDRVWKEWQKGDMSTIQAIVQNGKRRASRKKG